MKVTCWEEEGCSELINHIGLFLQGKTDSCDVELYVLKQLTFIWGFWIAL